MITVPHRLRSLAEAIAWGGLTLLTPLAHAALGDTTSSVEADRQQMHGELQSATAPLGYTVHEIRLPTGTTVREYVYAGRVFGLSWRGPVLPDLRQLLGASFADYRQAAATKHAGRRHLRIDRPDLVVHSNGHMRAFYGHAYLPALMPDNLRADDIR
jgi:hypothetical protein